MAALGPLIQCYACDNQATYQCRRCARVYCQLHGGELCAECMSPASSLPSFNLYRGSLLALLVGTAVALWLIVRPPGSGSGGVIISQVTPTSIVSQGTRTPAAGSPTIATPGTPATGTPASTATPEPRTYEVQDGDTLIGIATQFAPAGVDPFAYAQQIASANGIGVDQLINPGETLILP